MTTREINRPRYFQGQYLGANDFIAEQQYHRTMRRRHNLAHHTWGIVTGLTLAVQEQAGNVEVYVMPGLAIDGYGREIIVHRPHKLDKSQFLHVPEQAFVDVWIGYREEKASRTAGGYRVCEGNEAYERVRETFQIFVEPDQTALSEGVRVNGQEVEPPHKDTISKSTPDQLTIPRDRSVPYQELPEDSAALWLVRLGSVLWNGSTQKFEPVGDENQQKLTAGRRSAGAVTASLLAPANTLRIADRHALTVEPPTGSDKHKQYATLCATLEGSLEVVRRFSAQNAVIGERVGCEDIDPPARLHVSDGASLDEDKPTYLLLGQTKKRSLAFDSGAIQARQSENGAPKPGPLALQPKGGGLTVHAEKGEERAVLSFSAEGKLGLGTTTPAHPLHIARGDLAVSLDVNKSNTSGLAFHRQGTMRSRLAWAPDEGTLTLEAGTTQAARVHNRQNDAATALVVDASSDRDAILRLAEGGNTAWDMRHDADSGRFQVRYQGGRQRNQTVLSLNEDGWLGVGNSAPEAPLHIQHSKDAELRSGMPGTLLIGSLGRLNLALDTNEIQARRGTNASTLLLQHDGGDVEIGFDNPRNNAELRINGDVRLGADAGLYALAGRQNLRLIAGHVKPNGGVETGIGFRSSGGDGDYTITFISSRVPFSGPPVVVASLVGTPDDDNTLTVHNVSANGFDVVIKDVSGTIEGEKQASAFTFLAFGLVS